MNRAVSYVLLWIVAKNKKISTEAVWNDIQSKFNTKQYNR